VLLSSPLLSSSSEIPRKAMGISFPLNVLGKPRLTGGDTFGEDYCRLIQRRLDPDMPQEFQSELGKKARNLKAERTSCQIDTGVIMP